MIAWEVSISNLEMVIYLLSAARTGFLSPVQMISLGPTSSFLGWWPTDFQDNVHLSRV
jgi:hypothetical protein